MSRKVSLDIIKVIACFSVISLHTVGSSISVVNSALYYLAGCAVPLFFMVNGYLLLGKEKITYSYTIKKILNIAIVILIWNILFSIYQFANVNQFVDPLKESLNDVMQKGYFWQFWFFGSIILIYTVLPLIHKIYKKTGLFLVFLGLLAVYSFYTDISSFLGRFPTQSTVPQTLRVWTWLMYFCIGGFIKKYESKMQSLINQKTNLILAVVFSIVIVVYQYYVGHYVFNHAYAAEFFYDNIFTVLWIVSLFIFINRLDKIKNEWIVNSITYLSDHTMGIYIVHPTVILLSDMLYNYQDPAINILMTYLVFGVSYFIVFIIIKVFKLKKLVQLG